MSMPSAAAEVLHPQISKDISISKNGKPRYLFIASSKKDSEIKPT